ncbi:hypothetical protein [Larkinella rosea]|uniref:DoxX family membrane protein n=1 Tax=Larkinella rosea TaxID=2025312 RepID=A0A3P1BIN2_9BACT|nr:hypothetical protein [Larkinella rosea]RRB00969.1 hypothetical protein EHT25_22565 [Larkinella rosea]
MFTQNIRFYLELAARFYVFLILNLYGWAKMAGNQFFRPGHFPEKAAQIPLAEASGFELAWAFFGHSTSYILVIGLSQVIGAWLLLWDKTKLIGIAILLPVLLNIVIVDICFEVAFGAMLIALTCLLLLLLVLALNQSTVRALFALLWQKPVSEKMVVRERVKTIVIALVLAVLIFILENVLLQLIGQLK